jgi:hypothetical protein
MFSGQKNFANEKLYDILIFPLSIGGQKVIVIPRFGISVAF